MTKTTSETDYNSPDRRCFFIVIYADILFVINFFITLLLLRVTARLCKRDGRAGRLVLASAFGGAYAMIIFIELPKAVSFLLKFAAAFVIILFAFGFHRLKRFLLTYLVFQFVSFVFLGVTVGLCLLTKNRGIAVRNDTVYFDISAFGLLFCAAIAYLLSCLVVRLYNRKLGSGEVCTLTVTNAGSTVRLTALTDTGNRLREPFSDAPVIVAAEEKAKPLSVGATLRLIPTATVSGEACLQAFRPEKITVKTERGEREIENVYLALSTQMNGAAYSAVIPPEILSF